VKAQATGMPQMDRAWGRVADKIGWPSLTIAVVPNNQGGVGSPIKMPDALFLVDSGFLTQPANFLPCEYGPSVSIKG
jgi:hypothetical protein